MNIRDLFKKLKKFLNNSVIPIKTSVGFDFIHHKLIILWKLCDFEHNLFGNNHYICTTHCFFFVKCFAWKSACAHFLQIMIYCMDILKCPNIFGSHCMCIWTPWTINNAPAGWRNLTEDIWVCQRQRHVEGVESVQNISRLHRAETETRHFFAKVQHTLNPSGQRCLLPC